ncbi:hypothetical protein C0Q70_03327 [Pomacea canaliculata]|uniref:Uncharacterized protein n=1 Tax=Pomacea canaliculata TaxID=400727 RepID=A0A2T7PSF4_POMCA|nr:hypothetical protein C0Q70_03327 [Pomacea canaliculata]
MVFVRPLIKQETSSHYLEGSSESYVPLQVEARPLVDLKQLVLMHVPTSVSDVSRQKFTDLISEMLSGRCKKILAGILLTCPWWESTQKERGEQAKYNILLVVVITDDHQFFSPANPQIQEAGCVVDLGWLSVMELSHFGHVLAKGRTRSVEALYCPDEAVVYRTRPFLEACCGQAMGSIAKKRKNGGMKLCEKSTQAEICEAFRLLHHAHNHLLGQPPATSKLQSSVLPQCAAEALHKLQALYHDPDVSKQDIFDCMMSWHDELRNSIKKYQFHPQQDVEAVVGNWMKQSRLQGRLLMPEICPENDLSHLYQLMQDIGGPVVKMKPEQILLVARAGSFMYGLSTPESDADYIIVYKEPTEYLLSACKRGAECMESRGPDKKVEYGAYEARSFCEMLLKGSVIILEVVYLDDHDFVSPLWKILTQNKGRFVTELGIQQYLGLIKNNFHMIHSGRHKDTGRERKLFYQIFHKTDSVRYMMRGHPPPVRCSGAVRDFIMKVRVGEMKMTITNVNPYITYFKGQA